MKRNIRISLGLLLLVCLAGCSIPATPSQNGAPTITPTAVRQTTATPVRAAQPAITPTVAVTTTAGPLTLTWWAPESISPKAPQPAGPLLASILADFEATQEGKVRVNVIPKARYGKGGLLDYLRTAQFAAPSLLPDIIALDVAELETAASIGLLRPLDSLLDPTLLGELYPFARQTGQFGDQLLAVVYLADIEHAIYNQTLITEPPQTWAGLASSKVAYAFPTGSPQAPSVGSTIEDVQHNFISQYISAGAILDPKARHLTIQDQPLLRVLTFYADARQASLLPANITELNTLDDTWNVYSQGAAPLAVVSARRYLAGRADLKDTGGVAGPGWSNPVRPVAGGWALAITATDPARQRAAAGLLAWLLAPQRAGPFAQTAGWLPTSPQALNTWGNDRYYTFLDGQLATALSHPIGADYGPTAARLQRAVLAVLKGAAKPADAVQTALGGAK